MVFAFATSTREVLEQIVRDPRFKQLTAVPVLPLATVGLLAGVFAAFIGVSYLWLSDVLPTWLAIAANGALLYAIFTPLHDATHRTASGHPFINDLLGTIAMLGFIPGLTTRIYRYLHLEHHRYAGDPERDPDEVFVSARWPWTPLVMATPDITWTIWYLRAWRSRPRSERIEFSIGLTLYVAWHVTFLVSPYAYEFLVLWLVPQRIGMALVVFFFARIQHPEGVTWERSPFQTTVHIPTHPALRWLMLSQSEHHIHHLMPSVPFYAYHRAFELGEHLLSKQAIPQRGFFRPATEIAASVASTAERQQGVVRAVTRLTDDICAVSITAPDGWPPLAPFEAGAHVDVHLGDLIRQYSLYRPNDGTGTYHVAVKRELNGRGGSEAMHALKPGDTIDLGLPRNNFPLDLSADRTLLIAGGIGITPLWCMAQTLSGLGKDFQLLTFARSRPAMAFLDAMASAEFADRITMAFDDEGADVAEATNRHAGAWQPGKQLYVCGPTPFMAAAIAEAKALGWPDTAIHSETFVAPNVDQSANQPFDVVLARSGQRISVGANEYLIDALHQHGIAVTCSCTQGVCGSCVTDVLEGDVDHRDAFLDPAERGSKMTVCVSRAAGSQITLDL